MAKQALHTWAVAAAAPTANTVSRNAHPPLGLRPSATWRKRIVLGEDNEFNARMLIRLLQVDGYEVIWRRNGADALSAIAESMPHLVLLDVRLPLGTGVDVCQRVKTDERTRLVPVVLITGARDPEVRLRGIAAGADDFLHKPVNHAELRARIRSLSSAPSTP